MIQCDRTLSAIRHFARRSTVIFHLRSSRNHSQPGLDKAAFLEVLEAILACRNGLLPNLLCLSTEASINRHWLAASSLRISLSPSRCLQFAKAKPDANSSNSSSVLPRNSSAISHPMFSPMRHSRITRFTCRSNDQVSGYLTDRNFSGTICFSPDIKGPYTCSTPLLSTTPQKSSPASCFSCRSLG